MKGAHGWPLVPSKKFPGEQTLSCPECGGTNITLSSIGAGLGSGPGGSHRFGDPYKSTIKCNDCQKIDIDSTIRTFTNR